MSLYSFDQLSDLQYSGGKPQKPFWTIDLKDDEIVRRWIVETWDQLKHEDEGRFQIIQANIAAYRGIHYKMQDVRTRENNMSNYTPILRQPRVVVNHMLDLIEQNVSRITKYRPAVNLEPASDDYSDVQTAKIGDELVDRQWYMADIDMHFQTLQRHTRIIGEHFLWPRWCEDKGDLDPDYKEVRKKSKDGRVPVIGVDGAQVMGEDGKPLYVESEIREGEIEYKHIFSWDVQFQRKRRYEESEFAIIRDIEDLEDVKADYPKKADKISGGDVKTMVWDVDTFVEKTSDQAIEVFTFVHKNTKRLNNGFYAKVCRGVLLESGPLPDEFFGDFPWTRLTDIDYPGVLRGYALIEQGRQLQGLYNNLTSLMVKHLFACAHPKWMVPKNCCSYESLGNDTAIVSYQGPVPPRLENVNPVAPGVWNERDKTKEDLQQVMAVAGVSRGQPPPGVRAGIAIQYLDEKDNERQNTAVAKHNSIIRELAIKTNRVMSVKYRDPEGKTDKVRLAKILGKEWEYALKDFDVTRLADIDDARVQTTSALPQQRAARTQWILDMRREFPGILTDEQVVDLLGLGQVEKFKNQSTVAIRAADFENDVALRTGKVQPPDAYENHIQHYRQHLKLLADPNFKYALPEARRVAMEDHVKQTELLMFQAAARNPQYMAQIMANFPTFPAFLEQDVIDIIAQSMPMPAQPNQQAPMPAEVSQSGMNPSEPGMIPETQNLNIMPMNLTQSPVSQQ